MATKTTAKTTKATTTIKDNEKENKSNLSEVQSDPTLISDNEDKNGEKNTTSAESQLSQLMEMMAQMQSQITTMSSELASTKSELANAKDELAKAKEIMEVTELTELKEGVLLGGEIIANPNNFGQLADSTGRPYPVQRVNLSTNSDYNYTNTPQPIMATPSKADQYLEMLANRKSDREVTIVHNREVLGGGTTHIKLSNLEIDFTLLGETRTITYMQAEELVSKYRGFFNREIILIADKDRDIAERLKVPCVKRADGATLTRSDLNKLPTMSVEGLTKLYNSLSANDKKFMLSYWLGQCYTRTPGFYERYKIETLNSLSKNGTFDALLAFMNGEALNASRSNQSQTGGVVDSQIIPPGNQLNNLIDTHR